MCCNAPIVIVDSYKYLGLYLNEHLDVEQIVKSIANAAHLSPGLLTATHKALGGMPHQIFTKLYDVLVSDTRYTPNSALQGDMV